MPESHLSLQKIALLTLIAMLFFTTSTLGQNKDLVRYAQNNLCPKTNLLLSQSTDPTVKNQDTLIDFLIKVDLNKVIPSELQAAGATINTKAGDIWTIRLRSSALASFSKIKSVLFMEMARPLKIDMDVMKQKTGVDLVRQGVNLPKGYTGKGVLVGVMDIGFDLRHPTLYDSTLSRYRVHSYWNQISELGSQPTGLNYGSEYTTPADIIAQKTDRTDKKHGSHTMDIAAGSGPFTEGRLQGIAPESEIVLVGSNLNTAGQIDAFRYIFSKADELNMPCVINMSLGINLGPHDGTSLMSQAIDNLSGPGRIIVLSAGNEANKAAHLLAQNNIPSKSFWVLAQSNNSDNGWQEEGLIDIWGAAENPATFIEQLDTPLKPYLTLSEVFDTIDKKYFYTVAYNHDNNLIDFRLLLDCEGAIVCSGENYTFCANFLGLSPSRKVIVQGRRLDSLITICEGDSLQLEGFSRTIECDCSVVNPQGPIDCFPFTQPGGQWKANGTPICESCIDHTIHPKETTVYSHATPDYDCPFAPPPIGGGPLPPQGPVPLSFPAGPEIHILVEVDPVCNEGPNCNNNKGTIFFAPCDDGTEFFFIRTIEGKIYDPYFGADIVFDYYDGQLVNFDFESAPFSTPCSLAREAILLTCIEDATNPNPLLIDIFIDYPWLNDLVDEATCNISKINVYNQGAFNFVYTEAATGNILYFENGDFYCADAPNFNCLELYGLTNLISEWTCGETTNEALPPIPALTKVTICAGDTVSFAYPYEICGNAPLVLVQNGGNLPQDFGNFHVAEIENRIYFYPTTTVSYRMNPYQSGPEVIPTTFQDFCGNKIFEITVADNCATDTMGRVANAVISLEKESTLKPSLFPNPTSGQLTIQLPKPPQHQELRVFDLYGRQLQKLKIAAGQRQQLIDLSAFENGIYWVEWLNGFEREMFKVVKQ